MTEIEVKMENVKLHNEINNEKDKSSKVKRQAYEFITKLKKECESLSKENKKLKEYILDLENQINQYNNKFNIKKVIKKIIKRENI